MSKHSATRLNWLVAAVAAGALVLTMFAPEIIGPSALATRSALILAIGLVAALAWRDSTPASLSTKWCTTRRAHRDVIHQTRRTPDLR